MTRKKKLFSGLFALALLATTAFGVAESRKNATKMSDLVMANVEALARTEDDKTYKYVFPGADPTVSCVCSGDGSLSCC